ncbi:MAG: type I pullulanase [Bacteroidota bacterium]
MKKNTYKDASLIEAMKRKQAQKDSIFLQMVNDADNFPVYEGDDLGLTYSKKKSTFKLWSPPAKAVGLMFYKEGKETSPVSVKNMKKGKNGVWTHKAKGDMKGMYYAFQVSLGDSLLMETADPYAKAVGVNGKRAMVVDLNETNPKGWSEDQRPPLKSFSDIVLYELHMRDISINENSGIMHKGKFLGLAETGTKSPAGHSTGLDHIKELGVTHVHLLPSYDFYSIDETTLEANHYNWGYDPQNYNVPEGSYSTDPFDGTVRIREFKQLVKTLHDNGLRVIMDVVYNHTGRTWESVFNQTVPYYYYRTKGLIWSDAAACGNEMASDRYMYRKFMIESMKYWATEYHVDGFRVDLMGIHDIETMNQVAAALHQIDPTIFIYGEGWTAGESTLPAEKRALKANTKKLKGIAAFSDDFRDGVKGHVFTHNAKGFVSGQYNLEESVKFGIVGAVDHPQIDYGKVNYSEAAWANEPTQCINYVSCHDNHTLWDRLQLSCKNDDEATWLKINKLAQTIVLTSQGVPFLHAGEEFVRTKQLVENSYKSPDKINQINWDNKEKYNDLFQYYKALIQLRKDHPAFKMGKAELVRNHLKFLDIKQDNLIGYEIDGSAVGDPWKRILVLFNGQKVGKTVEIPKGNWKIICQNYRIAPQGMGTNDSSFATLMPYSAYILAEE